MSGVPPMMVGSAHDRPVLEQIDAQYGKADALALHFQKRSDQLFAFFNLVAFAMGLAYLSYEKFFSTRLLLFGVPAHPGVERQFVLPVARASLVREAPDVSGARRNTAREVLPEARQRRAAGGRRGSAVALGGKPLSRLRLDRPCAGLP